MVYALYRYRVARLLDMANMRTRIATDLHDDIGANLTRIALLSQVATQTSTPSVPVGVVSARFSDRGGRRAARVDRTDRPGVGQLDERHRLGHQSLPGKRCST